MTRWVINRRAITEPKTYVAATVIRISLSLSRTYGGPLIFTENLGRTVGRKNDNIMFCVELHVNKGEKNFPVSIWLLVNDLIT